MTNGYSNDLRERVLKYKDDNHTQVETCDVFGISRSTLNAWLKLRRETGSVNLRPRPRTRRPRKIDEARLRAYLEAHPDAYLREIGVEFEVSATAIMKACRRYQLTRKKRRHAISSETQLNVKLSKKP